MKRLLLSMAIILASLTVSSQAVTKTTTIDSIVPLPQNVAREIAKDLIRKDSLQSELDVANTNIGLLYKNLANKDSIISLKQQELNLDSLKGANYDNMLLLKDEQKANLQTAITGLEADLKKEKRKLAGRTILGAGIVVFLGYLLVR